MPKIKINTDSGEKEIFVKNPKKKHTKQLWEALKKLQKAEKSNYAMKFGAFIELKDSITMELTGIPEKEWDELDVIEIDKLTSVVGQATFGEIDFSKLFGKPQD